jgi:hypothetical protein
MKNNILYIILISVFGLLSCDDYLDINDDPNAVTDASLSALLAPTMEATARNYYNTAFTTSQISQQTGSVFAAGADIHEEFRLGGIWSGVYLSALTNLGIIVEKAEAEGSPHYAGVAKVLQATNLGLATDQWGDIPWTEAFVEGNLNPKYDSQETIYAEIQRLLDEAIEDLSSTESRISPDDEDIIYNGDLSKWLKTAYSLKARYYIHLTKRTGAAAAQNALDAVANGFESNADDFELFYNGIIRNPWHLRPALANNTGNASIEIAQQLVNAMNGTNYPTFDPRLPIIANNGGVATYTGLINGEGTGGNSGFSEDTWYSTETAPVLLMTYAELKLIEAEASLIVGESTEAYEAYITGIEAHMNKLGVIDTVRQKYINDPSVSVGADSLAIEQIMKEKYVALFINPEAWNDLRRYDYDPTIFRNFDLPENHNPILNDQFIRRASYPDDEFSRNAVEVSKVEKDLDVPVWWDQN